MSSQTDASRQEGMRINKYIAHTGYCSRRDADQLVEEGRVKIDGDTVTEHGTRVNDGQTVTVDDEVVELRALEHILLNKPKDTISTTDDQKDRQTVLDVVGVPAENPSGLFPVGRLGPEYDGCVDYHETMETSPTASCTPAMRSRRSTTFGPRRP